MRNAGLLLLILFSSSLLSIAQNEPKRSPSTPEERKRFLSLTRKLEQNPLDKSLYEDKKWAKQWLDDVPDINVNICPLLFGVEFMKEQNKYAAQLFYQATFGSAAYIIEHPDKAGDTAAQFVAGVESALKAYSAIVKSEPQAKSKALDDLLEKQKQGKLADFVHGASKSCEDKKEGI
jgi:ABC-type nitrate/sulfonate/bicarbonate transport system substrate-binding protein